MHREAWRATVYRVAQSQAQATNTFTFFTTPYSVMGTSLNAGSCKSQKDLDLIPGSGRSPGEGNGNPLQYSCLEDSMDRGDLQDAVRLHRVRHD